MVAETNEQEHGHIVLDNQICLVFFGESAILDDGTHAALDDRVESDLREFNLSGSRRMQGADSVCIVWSFDNYPGASEAFSHLEEMKYLFDAIFPSSEMNIILPGRALPQEFQSQ